MGVTDRNRILFHRVFRAHHWVWCAITPSFCRGWGSYVLNRCIRYSCICTLHMSPALSGSLARKRVKLSDVLEIHNGMISNFYLGLPHMVFRNMESKQSIQYLMWTQRDCYVSVVTVLRLWWLCVLTITVCLCDYKLATIAAQVSFTRV